MAVARASSCVCRLWKAHPRHRHFRPVYRKTTTAPAPTEPVPTWFESWRKMNAKSKDTILEIVGRVFTLAVGGGGSMVLASTLLKRMDTIEDKVEGSIKEVKNSVEDLKSQMTKSEDDARKNREEVEAKYLKLQAELNQMSTFKDIWIAGSFKRSAGSESERV